MAGGSGTRFWPWSREGQPKQLLALASKRSMLAETVARLKGLVPKENILIVTGRRHQKQVRAQLPELDASQILAEPVGRNTAACIGWATLEIEARRANAVTAVLSADHLVGSGEEFRSDLGRAFAIADRTGRLLTFGVKPGHPATGYGYIRTGAAVSGASPARDVEAFVEKPKLAVAKRYVASGKHYWNSGIFVWRADVIRAELAAHLPGLTKDLELMMKKRGSRGVSAAVLDRCYPSLESISIDYGVLEKSGRVAMLPVSFPWSDIGSWDAVAELWPADPSKNASRDPVLAVDASANIVATRGKPVVLLGVEDLVIVDAGDALMVCSRERCQDIKTVVARLEQAGLGALK